MSSFDPAEIGGRAVALYDGNKDGKLDAGELEKCPALKSALARADKNKDGCLDAEEIAERIEQYRASGVALTGVACIVTRDGQGVAGVTVTFVPESFMGDAAKKATGTSAANGNVQMATEGEPFPGVRLGFYRVEASLKDAAGNETVPARFNTATVLGQEVAHDSHGTLTIRLP